MVIQENSVVIQECQVLMIHYHVVIAVAIQKHHVVMQNYNAVIQELLWIQAKYCGYVICDVIINEQVAGARAIIKVSGHQSWWL